MKTTEMTLNEIRERGLAALVRELGPIGYTRFLQQFSTGSGDYTAERGALIGRLDLSEIHRILKERNKPVDAESG